MCPKYQEMGFGGSVSAQQMTANTFRIIARGNGYTSSTTVQDYTMLKAAEVTKQQGGSHFELISASDASHVGQFVTPGSAQTTFRGNSVATTYMPANVQSYFKPGQDAYIRILRIPEKGTPPVGAISADEILQYVGGRIKRE